MISKEISQPSSNSHKMPSQTTNSDSTEGLHARLSSALARRRAAGLLRSPRARDATRADFSSNDYLGVVTRDALRTITQSHGSCSTGSTGSRLLSGHFSSSDAVETEACEAHNSPTALLFNSGYDANLAFFGVVPGPRDAVILDELIHASVHDGVRSSRACARISFRHNDCVSLKRAIMQALDIVPGSILVGIESVYSMDGDVAPLDEFLVAIKAARASSGREIFLVVDEAHSGGLYGKNGGGLAMKYASHEALLARLITYGKAYGSHGAVILCQTDTLRDYLLNYARSLIYTTSLPPHSHSIILASYAWMRSDEAEAARRRLWVLRDRFRRQTSDKLPGSALLEAGESSAIQGILIPGNRRVSAVAQAVLKAGYDVYPIRAPTVPRGGERLRIVLHAHNTEEEVDGLVDALVDAVKYVKFSAML